MEETNFWDDHKKAQDIINEKKELLEIVEKIELLKSKINDVLDLSDEELEFFALEINELKNEFSLLKHMFYLVVHMIKIMQFLKSIQVLGNRKYGLGIYALSDIFKMGRKQRL